MQKFKKKILKIQYQCSISTSLGATKPKRIRGAKILFLFNFINKKSSTLDPYSFLAPKLDFARGSLAEQRSSPLQKSTRSLAPSFIDPLPFVAMLLPRRIHGGRRRNLSRQQAHMSLLATGASSSQIACRVRLTPPSCRV